MHDSLIWGTRWNPLSFDEDKNNKDFKWFPGREGQMIEELYESLISNTGLDSRKTEDRGVKTFLWV